jgi:hypothetical protein
MAGGLMRLTKTCEACGKPYELVFTDEDIESMEALHVDWRNIEGRCAKCQREVLVRKRRPAAGSDAGSASAKPMSDAEIRERMPLSVLAASRGEPAKDADTFYLSPDYKN